MPKSINIKCCINNSLLYYLLYTEALERQNNPKKGRRINVNRKYVQAEYIDGRWQPGRSMNGDQSHQDRHLRIPAGDFGIQRITLYRYN